MTPNVYQANRVRIIDTYTRYFNLQQCMPCITHLVLRVSSRRIVRACVRSSASVSHKSFTRPTAATFPTSVMDEPCLPFSSVLSNCCRSRLSIPSSARLRVFDHGAPANADREIDGGSSRRSDGVNANSARERNSQKYFIESSK